MASPHTSASQGGHVKAVTSLATTPPPTPLAHSPTTPVTALAGILKTGPRFNPSFSPNEHSSHKRSNGNGDNVRSPWSRKKLRYESKNGNDSHSKLDLGSDVVTQCDSAVYSTRIVNPESSMGSSTKVDAVGKDGKVDKKATGITVSRHDNKHKDRSSPACIKDKSSLSTTSGADVKGCNVGRHCRIGDNCDLKHVVLHDYVTVGANTILHNTIVGANSQIGDDCHLKYCEVGANKAVPAGTKARGAAFTADN